MARKKSHSVGYGNPPMHTRFPKGTSGNRRGRPKGSQSYLDSFQKILAKRITVTGPDGRRRTVSTMDALFLNLRKKAFDGDIQASKLMIELAKGLEVAIEEKKTRPLTIVLTGADVHL
jgi:hypothetical protein